jgi:hypothetical protein
MYASAARSYSQLELIFISSNQNAAGTCLDPRSITRTLILAITRNRNLTATSGYDKPRRHSYAVGSANASDDLGMLLRKPHYAVVTPASDLIACLLGTITPKRAYGACT